MYKNNKAFSLLELLIVFVIIGILSAITIPSYQKHITRAKILDALNFVNSIKIAATDFYFQNGFWPDNKDLDLESEITNHNYIKKIILNPDKNSNNSENISVILKGDNKLENKVLLFNSILDNYSISWKCYSASINQLDANLLPKNCSNN